MTNKDDFDQSAAHKYFSADCFNKAWDLIDKEQRSPEEDEAMIRLSLTSHYHWTQRPDYSNSTASIGYWQTSRIYAVLGQAENALRYGNLCLQASQKENVPPFFLGYAYEALARAAATAGNQQDMTAYLDKATAAAEQVQEAENREALLDDLKSVQIRL